MSDDVKYSCTRWAKKIFSELEEVDFDEKEVVPALLFMFYLGVNHRLTKEEKEFKSRHKEKADK